MVNDCFSNRRGRVILFTVILMFWSIFAFSCEIDGANNSNSDTPKVRVSGEFIIFVGSVIAFILECINNRSNNMDVICGALVIIGAILYLIAMFMDVNNTYGDKYACLVAAGYIIPGVTALFVGIDITGKVQAILNNIRARICIFSLLLAISGILILIWYFSLDQNWEVTDEQQWYEAGWMLIVIASFFILLVVGLFSKNNICLFNVIFGFILFAGAGIVLYVGSDMTYNSRNFSCSMKNIGYYVIVFIDAFVVIWDVQVGASVGSGGGGYSRM